MHDTKPTLHLLWNPLCGVALAVLGIALAPHDGSACDGELDDATSGLDGAWGEGFALLATGGGLHAVLDVTTDAELHAGAPRLADRRSHVVHATLLDDAARERLGVWSARPLEVVTDRGARCPARVADFEYRADVIPEHHELLQWNGISDVPELVLAPLRGAELAAAVWDSAWQRMITARLRVDGSCEGTPVYVRDAAAPPARVATPLPAVPQRSAVLDAFRALPAYAQTQVDFMAGGAGFDPGETSARWEDYDRTLTAQAFLGERGDVLVSVSVPFVDCAAWDPALWAVFRLGRAGEPPALVHTSREIAPAQVRLILEGEGGGLDFVIEDALELGGLSVVRGDQRLAGWAPELHGCGC